MSSVEVIECDQNSPEWTYARLGLPTASMFAAILAKGEGKTRRSYLYKLAGELLTGEPTESYTNEYMERGHAMEGDARELYSFMTDADPFRVGFIRNGPKGCSPDSLIGDKGILEIKTKRSDLLIETLIKDKFPSEHVAQCQGALWVAEREWIDIACYWPKLPLFVKRAHRDEAYISELSKAVAEFNAELLDTVTRIRSYGTGSHEPLMSQLRASVAQAAQTAEAVIAESAALLIRDPWRADRIIPGASAMTADEVEHVIARILPHTKDMSRMIALKGLLRASKSEEFGPEWARPDA